MPTNTILTVHQGHHDESGVRATVREVLGCLSPEETGTFRRDLRINLGRDVSRDKSREFRQIE